jgi:hypothetical protein
VTHSPPLSSPRIALPSRFVLRDTKVRAGAITEDEYHNIIRVTRSASQTLKEDQEDGADDTRDRPTDESSFDTIPLDSSPGASPRGPSPSAGGRWFFS